MQNSGALMGIKSRFLLKIFEGFKKGTLSEELWDGNKLIMQGEGLMVSSALMNCCYPIIKGNEGMAYYRNRAGDYEVGDVYSSIAEFYDQILTDKEILDKPVPLLVVAPMFSSVPGWEKASEMQGDFGFELTSLCSNINAWLNPRFKKEHPNRLDAKRHFEFGSNSKYGEPTYNLFTYRCEELKLSPIYDGNHLRMYYRSNGLITLAWAELLTAIQNKIQAGVCPYCGKVYQISPTTPTKASCASEPCKKAQIKRSQLNLHGPGWDTARKANTDHNRGPGRPKSSIRLNVERLAADGCSNNYIADKLKVEKRQISRWLRPKTASV
ncbi:MAG: hypothetical protein ACM3UZ_03815 [Acidobacteriota bacterium]